MTPRTGNQKEKYRHEKTRKVRWMQKFGLVKDIERDGKDIERDGEKRGKETLEEFREAHHTLYPTHHAR